MDGMGLAWKSHQEGPRQCQGWIAPGLHVDSKKLRNKGDICENPVSFVPSRAQTVQHVCLLGPKSIHSCISSSPMWHDAAAHAMDAFEQKSAGHVRATCAHSSMPQTSTRTQRVALIGSDRSCIHSLRRTAFCQRRSSRSSSSAFCAMHSLMLPKPQLRRVYVPRRSSYNQTCTPKVDTDR